MASTASLRHLVRLTDLEQSEVDSILDASVRLRHEDAQNPLTGRTIGLLFFRGSLRTRASFEAAVVDSLVDQTLRAARDHDLERILVAGGVACNQRLREVMAERAAKEGRSAHFPTPEWCTDNAVMIAGLGWELWRTGALADLSLDASPR